MHTIVAWTRSAAIGQWIASALHRCARPLALPCASLLRAVCWCFVLLTRLHGLRSGCARTEVTP
jgi:hypothetical protein